MLTKQHIISIFLISIRRRTLYKLQTIMMNKYHACLQLLMSLASRLCRFCCLLSRRRFRHHLLSRTTVNHLLLELVRHGLVFLFLVYRFFFLLHLLLVISSAEKCISSKVHSLKFIIRDNNIIKERAGLDLPQLKTNVRTGILLGAYIVQGIIWHKCRVINHGMLPCPLIVRIAYLLRVPRTMIIRIVNHGWLPFPILLIIPVLWLGSVRIGNFRRHIIITLRLDALRIVHIHFIHPILWLGCVRIGDGPRFLQKWEEILQTTITHAVIVHKYFKPLIRMQYQSILMAGGVHLTRNVRCNHYVLALTFFGFTVQNHMRTLGRSADIRAKHDGIRRISAKGIGIKCIPTWQQFNVGSTAFLWSFILYGVLKDQFFILVDEWGCKGGRQAVKAHGVLRHDALVFRVRAVVFPGCVFPFSHFRFWPPFGWDGPAIFPSFIEFFLEINGSIGCSNQASGCECEVSSNHCISSSVSYCCGLL
mmetsp:Transcript_20159/g.30905  ORF Transcript_20159/g.30905 Transcript_20159/m.30905 type:complete len:477 (+) Transcript_20159:117-1547(+)